MKSKLTGLMATTALLATSAVASAQSASGNAGADKIIDQVDTLPAVAALVVASAVLVVVVPWGAKMAIRAFKSIGAA